MNEEKILFPEKKHWYDSTIDRIINNKIYMGDYEQYKYDNDKETELFVDVVPSIITKLCGKKYKNKKRKTKEPIVETEFIYSFKTLYVLLVDKIMSCKGYRWKKI